MQGEALDIRKTMNLSDPQFDSVMLMLRRYIGLGYEINRWNVMNGVLVPFCILEMEFAAPRDRTIGIRIGGSGGIKIIYDTWKDFRE